MAKRQAEELVVHLSQSKREPVNKAADYIDNNKERLQYDQAQGLPIAAGVIE